MKKCALLTCDDLSGYVTDEHHLEKALEKANWSYDWVSWNQENVNWNNYQFSIVRTTWDYIRNRPHFLDCLQKIDESQCQLLNPIDLIKWNIDKIYLKELSGQGVEIVPTLWLEYHNLEPIVQSFKELGTKKIVVKPRVGAGAANTFLISSTELSNFTEPLSQLKGCNIMVQPFMEQVSLKGEYSVHYFGGKLSHAILKKPKQGDFRSQEEFGSQIVLVELNEKQKDFCQKVVEKIKGIWLYARVDFVYNDMLEENLMELELIEPSLYFRYKEGSAEFLVNQLKNFI